MSAASRRGSAVRAMAWAVATSGLGVLPVWMVSAYAPAVQRALSIDETQFGLVLGLFFAASALGGIPLGHVTERIAWRVGVAITASVAAIALVGTGLAATGIVSLIVWVGLGALANGTSQPTANLIVALRVPSRIHGFAFGLKQASLPTATLAAGASVSLFSGGSSWREAFVCAGIVAVCIAVAAAVSAGLESRECSLTPESVAPAAARPPADVTNPRGLLALLTLAVGCATVATMSLTGFVVVYAASLGATDAAAARLLVLGSILSVASRIVCGILVDRPARSAARRDLVIVAGMMVVGAAALALIGFRGSQPALLLIGVALGFAFGWSWNGVMHLVIARRFPGRLAVATGVTQSAVSVGSAIGPVLFGVLSQWSYAVAWLGAAVFLGLGAVFALVARWQLRST